MDLRWTDLLDVGIVAVLLSFVIVWLRQTRARMAFVGLGILAVVYVGARRLDLPLTAWLLQGFFAVLLVVLVVVFQEDLRRLFERVGVWGSGRRASHTGSGAVDSLVRAVVRLATERRGALIVLPGHDPLDRHLEGGVPLDGRLSEPLLLSLFDPHSPGHDGAVLLQGNRVLCFAAYLPLSADREQLGQTGTRHAAALGLAERTDAVCVVVSEERGSVSIARAGRIRTLERPDELGAELLRFAARVAPRPKERRRRWPALGVWREALLALLLATLLWLLFVPGSTVVDSVREVPVIVENLPKGYELEQIDPERVEVHLSGPRRELYFADPALVQLRVDALLVKLGRRTFDLTAQQVKRPTGVEVLEINPRQVRLSVRREPSADEPS